MANNGCNKLRVYFSIVINLLRRYATKKYQEPKNTAPVRCFHLTVKVLSGEKHRTSAMDFSTFMDL